jgi:hypothetical protein
MRRILEWNGRDLPEVLRDLRPGRYSIEVEPDYSEDEQDELRKLAARCADLYACD